MTLDRRRRVWAKQIVYINVLDPSIVKGNNTQADYVIRVGGEPTLPIISCPMGAEIREYAKVILDMAKVVAPVSFTEFVPLVLEEKEGYYER